MTDLSRMNVRELIRFAEEQARIERERPANECVEPPIATWAATIAVPCYMEQHGIPDAFKQADKLE